ncbi:hypothetical protein H5410_010782 [Solanum commersonii]|uniref:6.7 kDa chloroplast outer envelope membrane protein n=1 Tax=Solanum commersonii TaxID=4109 RepID=A0A9J6AMI0_SOLCO|nr:hypothetical protein H5410_010782 [Solanum commersonii]
MAKNNSLKSTLMVFGALIFGWLVIELAFKLWLDKAQSFMDKSDPSRDPDDDTTYQSSEASKSHVIVDPPKK